MSKPLRTVVEFAVRQLQESIVNRRSVAQQTVALLAALAILYPWPQRALAATSTAAVAGTVSQSGIVTPGGTTLTNPPGPDDTHGVFEIDLNELRSFVPGSELGSASLKLVGAQFDVPKTLEIRTYAGDLELSQSDFGAGTRSPIFSHTVSEPTGPDGLTLICDLIADDLNPDGGVLGFNLRESESSGHYIISVEMLFICVILVIGVIGGLAAIRAPAEPVLDPEGLPTGEYRFGTPEVTFTSIPEPSTLALAGMGALALLGFAVRRRFAR